MSRWIRLAVSLYPKRWRQRYSAELEDLIEQSGPGWRVGWDVLRGAAAMRLREVRAVPVFTLTAIVTLATAIGANALIFTIVYGVLLKPLPFPAPHQLVAMWHTAPGLMPGPLDQAAFTYFTYRDGNTTFEDIGLWTMTSATVVGRGEPEELRAMHVTDGTLPVLRVGAALGRVFSPEDDLPGARDTVMVSHAYWRRALQGSPAAIGQSLVVDGRAREVIGVLPERFRLLHHSPDLLLPLRLNRAQTQVGLFRYQGVARLKPGVSMAEAHADLARLIPGMPDQYPIPTGFTRDMYDAFQLAPDLRPLHYDLAGSVAGMLWILFGAVLLLLLVACANVANLFLVRGESRRQELAVRLALGAGRWRVAGQLLGESLTLALASGVLGVLLARAGLSVLRAMAPGQLPPLDDVGVEPVVVAFAMILAVIAGVLFSVFPIRRYTRPDLSVTLRESARGASDGRERHRLRNALVAVQVAVALVLMIGSLLMVRSFAAIREVAPGFVDGGSVLTMRINIAEAVMADPPEVARTHDQILHAVLAIPGVRAAGLTSSVTMDGAFNRDPLFAEGVTEDGGWPPVRRMKWASPGYFAAVGNPVVAGRDFTWDEVHGHRAVGIVTENLARALFGSAANALGRRVRPSPNGPWREIVGVVGNEHDEGPTRPATPTTYWPILQEGYVPDRVSVQRSLVYAIRTDRVGDPDLLRDLQRAVWSVNPSLPLSRVRTLADIAAQNTAQTSFTLLVLLVASAVTLLLGVVGIYGVIAYVVLQRRREVGIRVALGAGPGEVQRMFLLRGLATVGAGLIAGGLAATAASRVLGGLLFEVAPLDPAAYALAIAVLAAVAAVAIWLPARAATRVAPGIVLRG